MMPDQDAVVIVTSETANMQDELNLIWTYLLPAFKTGPVAVNANETAALKRALSVLKLSAASSIADPPITKTISGRNFAVDSNDQKINEVSFSFQDNLCTLKFIEPDSTYTVVFGKGKWVLGETRLPNTPPSLIRASKGPFTDLGPSKMASAYSWKDDHTRWSSALDSSRVRIRIFISASSLTRALPLNWMAA